MWDDIALEMAIEERQALEKACRRVASQQLGEAWIDLPPQQLVDELALKSEVFNHVPIGTG